jgi:hypothetical protein
MFNTDKQGVIGYVEFQTNHLNYWLKQLPKYFSGSYRFYFLQQRARHGDNQLKWLLVFLLVITYMHNGSVPC